MRLSIPILLITLIVLALPPATPTTAQQACGVIDSPDLLDYPLDRFEFQLIQPFGRGNQRYDGQLHAGDDWVRTGGSSLGQPVYAIGPGRVTYSSPTGWGADKGVVIIQHQFADGSVYYSLYGHMEETDDIKFVQRGSCVSKGDIVGTIGDPRPAPHLHFEIRNFDPFTPGPGYASVDPRLFGWYNPHQFIDNWKGWLHPAHRWHFGFTSDQGPLLPPVLRTDGSLVTIDGFFMSIVDANGRLLYNYGLAESVQPVGLAELNSDLLLMGTADGRILLWNAQAGLMDQWVTGLERMTVGPIVFGNRIIVGDDSTFMVFDSERNLLQTYHDAGILDYAVTNQLAAILVDGRLLLIGTGGQLVQHYEMKQGVDLVPSPDGGFIVRNQGDLVYISPQGEWSTIREGLSVNRSDATLILDAYNGQIIAWGIEGPSRLIAFSLQGDILWYTDLSQVDYYGLSNPVLIQANRCAVTLVSQRGTILGFDTQTGILTSQISVWGDSRATVWAGLQNNLLRLQIGGQVLALDVPTFTGYCQGSS
ncbi:MAG: M23 family metallopeptidase [Anaerolineales bacterium]|nr:M23 family metallopeptidase [Anaerolineales bacterium]